MVENRTEKIISEKVMCPSSENPLVKETINDSLYELANSMLFLVDSMPTMVEENPDDDGLLIITPHKFSGFKNNLDVIRAATESIYTQYQHDKHDQHSRVTALEQKLANAQKSTVHTTNSDPVVSTKQ